VCQWGQHEVITANVPVVCGCVHAHLFYCAYVYGVKMCAHTSVAVSSSVYVQM
jgi:hypothetical protein